MATRSGRALRAAAINTIPHSTGAAKAIGKVVPEVNGKLQGHAQRVQVPDGSITELFTVLEKEATVDEINAAFKDAFADCAYYGYNDDEIVSGDIVGDTHGGVLRSDARPMSTTVDGVTMAAPLPSTTTSTASPPTWCARSSTSPRSPSELLAKHHEPMRAPLPRGALRMPA